jgi:protoheme ferro-lyase/multisubunit Na+/H+ antiporter MnhF subunit
MDFLGLIIPSLLGFFAGFFYVQYLTVHPTKMGRYLTIDTLLIVGAILCIIDYSAKQNLYISIILSILSFIGGYAFATKQLMGMPDNRPAPPLLRSPDTKGDGHTAVIYFTHGEPATYTAVAWVNQFREYDETGVKFVPFLARPFFIKSLRDHYLIVGSSHHDNIHKEMIKTLEKMYRDQGDSTTKFYLSFLDSSPRPEAAVIRALNEGASSIIACVVFLTKSNHTLEGEEQIKKVLSSFNIPVSFTRPLYDSETLKSMFVQRLNSHVDGFDKTKVGVLLVGHGQPDEWDKDFPTETQQELQFKESILELLSRDGYKRENMSLAWMEFKHPKPKEKIEEFVKNGITRIYYFPAAISADSIHSQYDIPALVAMANTPKEVQFFNLGAWNNDPIVVRAIKQRIDEYMS